MYCVTFAESEPYCHSILFVCLDVCRSFRNLQPTTSDRSQPNLVGRYVLLSSDPCKFFWIPYLPYFRCQREKYTKFPLFPSERDASCHMTCLICSQYMAAEYSVSPHACILHKFTNHVIKLQTFCACYLWPLLDPPLQTALRYVMDSCFVDDVTFS